MPFRPGVIPKESPEASVEAGKETGATKRRSLSLTNVLPASLSSRASGILEKVQASTTSPLSGTSGPRVRDYSEVEVVEVKVGTASKEMYLPTTPKKLEEYGVRTWSYPLTVRARYAQCAETMEVKGEALKRTLHELLWARSALVAEQPGCIVPPLPSDACGDGKVVEQWFERCLAHPAMASSAVFKCLALSPPSEFVAAQRDFVADLGAPPPLAVQLNALYLKSKEKLFDRVSPGGDSTATKAEETKKSQDEDDHSTDDQSPKVRAATEWIAAQSDGLELTLEACTNAAVADTTREDKALEAAVFMATHLCGSGDEAATLTENAAFATSEKFGPSLAAPCLRDMLGYLGAAKEAIDQRKSALLKVLAAEENLKKHTSSAKSRVEYMKKADERREMAVQIENDGLRSLSPQAEGNDDAANSQHTTFPTATSPAVQRAKTAIASFGYKAAGAFSKTAAVLASDDADVDKAKLLVESLQAKFDAIDATFAAEFNALQESWPQKLHDAYRAYANAETRRAQAAAAQADALARLVGSQSAPSTDRLPEPIADE